MCEGDTVQTTLLGLAIALIVALVAALIGPYFIDWNQFRPQFEAEATRVVGAPVHVGGKLDARLLPTPSLRLRSVVVGGANDLGKVRADKLDVEFSLGSLMRGEWRATELTINGLALDLGLDRQGRIDWPASSGTFNLGSLAIDRLNLTGRVALHDAASRGTLELNDIAFSGDVRSLAGAMRGDGNFTLSGTRYPFRVSSGHSTDGSGTRIHLNIDPGAARALSADLEGVLVVRGARAALRRRADARAPPVNAKAANQGRRRARRGGSSPRSRPIRPRAGLEQLEASYGAEDRALKFAGLGRGQFRRAAAASCGAFGTATRCRQVRRQDVSDKACRAGTVVARPARAGRFHAAAADPGASRVQFRTDHAGRPAVAEHHRRSCMAMPSHGASTGWIFARPARPRWR